MAISPVHEIIQEVRAGRMVILVDEEDRENEGDLVLASEFVTPEAINFMAKFGRGLICLTLTRARAQELGLKPMVLNNGTQYGTNFTVSIEAAEGVTTGISAADRARTIQVAVSRHSVASDLVQPGHVFPLVAVDGGVLMRAGHTEAGCDLAAMAGLMPSSVICEIMKDDGTMDPLPDLIEFAATHQLKIGTISDLIEYRSRNESLIQKIHERPIHTSQGEFRCVAYQDTPTQSVHFALIHGQIHAEDEILVRVHEPTSLVDLLEQELSLHSFSVAEALVKITQQQSGVLILLNCGVTADALLHQFVSLDTIDGQQAQPPLRAAIEKKADLRTYGIGAQILRDLGVRRMKLLAKPRKMPSMVGFDLQITGYVEKEII